MHGYQYVVGFGVGERDGDGAVDGEPEQHDGTVIGSNCSLSSPCEYRIGSVVYSAGAPATLDVSSSSGLVYLYIDPSGLLTAGESATGNPALTCTGCQVLGGITQFPAYSIPLCTWNITNGTFDSTGTDSRAVLAGGTVIAAGSNVAITQARGASAISAVDASGLSGGSGSGSGSGSGGGSGVTVAGSGSELQYNNYGSLGAVTGSAVPGSTVQLGGAIPQSPTQSLLGLGNTLLGGNPNGTVFGINAPSGYSGDIIDVMSNNSSIFSLDPRVRGTFFQRGIFEPLPAAPAGGRFRHADLGELQREPRVVHPAWHSGNRRGQPDPVRLQLYQ